MNHQKTHNFVWLICCIIAEVILLGIKSFVNYPLFLMPIIVIAVGVVSYFIANMAVKKEEKEEAQDAMNFVQQQDAKVKADVAAEPADDEWKCSECGSINKNYVGTCGCGQKKADNVYKKVDLSDVPEGKWKCRNCLELNPNVVTKCIHCGEKK